MKKITLCLMATFLSLTFVPVQSYAGTETVASVTGVKEAEAAKAKTLLSRLDEIDKMDKSALNTDEKKGLRKEVRSIRQELKKLNSGIYLSVGAIILIVILLIVLF